ncbi:MAG: hypothetical protein HXY26_06035 [Hydrogenophilaceae bacterium]|nr:hypothetical protein [Hydrogenophilaceae bacterium]
MLSADDVQIAHFLPGRVRLKVPALRGRAAEAEVLGSAFRSIPGVKSLEISTVTGSVLIIYDVSALAGQDASRQLKTVLQDHLPGLDADRVLKWLGAP